MLAAGKKYKLCMTAADVYLFYKSLGYFRRNDRVVGAVPEFNAYRIAVGIRVFKGIKSPDFLLVINKIAVFILLEGVYKPKSGFRKSARPRVQKYLTVCVEHGAKAALRYDRYPIA